MPGFDVTPAELQATAAFVSQLGDDIRSEVMRLGVDAGALLDGGWRGEAATAFGQGWEQWTGGATELLDALDAMARLLAATGQAYGSAEDESARAALTPVRG